MKITDVLKENFASIDFFIFDDDTKSKLESIEKEDTIDQVLKRLTPENKIKYQIKNCEELIEIINLSTDEVLFNFGFRKAEFGNKPIDEEFKNKIIHLIPSTLFNVLNDGMMIATLAGEYEILNKKDFAGFTMPVYPIGFIK